MTFASEGVTINTNQPGYAYLTNGTLTLTADISSQATSAYLNSLVSIREFSASFTYTATTSGGFFADGAAFVIQNSPQQASALGTAGSGLGYEGITSSAALAFNIYGGHPIGITLARDGYLNNYQYTGTGNVSLVSYLPVRVDLVYSGGVLSTKLTDVTSGSIFQTSYLIDLPSRVGGDLAYVGFTGATGLGVSVQQVSEFTFTTVPEPPVAMLLLAGAAGIRWRLRRRGAGRT